MARNRLERVGRATGFKSAPPELAKQKQFSRRDHQPIKPDTQDQSMLGCVHIPCFNNPALRRVVKKSLSTAASGLPMIDGRAMRTRSTGAIISCWCKRKVSRSSRRARLRSTAFPRRRAVITPSRECAAVAKGCQFEIKHPVVTRSPRCRTRAKSRPCLIRAARPNRRRFGVSPPMIKLNGSQTLASGTPAVPQDCAATLTRITIQKPMLAFASDF